MKLKSGLAVAVARQESLRIQQVVLGSLIPKDHHLSFVVASPSWSVNDECTLLNITLRGRY